MRFAAIILESVYRHLQSNAVNTKKLAYSGSISKLETYACTPFHVFCVTTTAHYNSKLREIYMKYRTYSSSIVCSCLKLVIPEEKRRLNSNLRVNQRCRPAFSHDTHKAVAFILAVTSSILRFFWHGSELIDTNDASLIRPFI